jgi:competence protein ComEC
MPLFWLSLSFLSGVVLAAVWPQASDTWLVLAGLSLALLLLSRLLPRLEVDLPEKLERALARFLDRPASPLFPSLALFIPLSLTALFIGAARYQQAQPEIDPAFIAWHNDGEFDVAVTGVVVAPPDVRDRYINLRVAAEQLRPAHEITHTAVEGLLLARVPTDVEAGYGDRVVLEGLLQTPPENEAFSYREYLARQGIYSFMPFADAGLLESGQGSTLYTAIFQFREYALDTVYRLFPDPEASLAAGILLGVESGIPADVDQAFNDTGTSHVIAISGFNIAILAGLLATLFGRWLGLQRGALVAAIGIAVYTILVGADAAVVRAAIMGWVALLARQVGRQQVGLNTLSFTAALMALGEPQILWDVGFQLSFAATFGLILFAQPFTDGFVALASRWLPETSVKKLAGPAGEYLLFTVAAQITTLPVIAYYFQRVSLISLPANLVILPVQPPVMIVSGLAVLLAMVWFPLGQLAAYVAFPFIAFTIRAVEWFASLPGGLLLLGRVPLAPVFLFYLLLLAAAVWRPKLNMRLPAFAPGLLVAAAALFTNFAWQASANPPDGLLHLTILDVGTGDGLLIQTPGGRYVLVDGGPGASQLSDALGRRLPIFHRELDHLVVAGPREEQVAALPGTVERFLPGAVLWAGAPNASRSASFLQEVLLEEQIPIVVAEQGYILDLGGGARLRVLGVGARGATLLLEWGNFRALLPVGITFDEIAALDNGRAIGPVTALLLADSGFAPLNPPDWVRNLNPQVVMLSVAAGDFDGLPSAETLNAVATHNLLRTDHNGWIELITDGRQLWAQVERQ